MLNKISYFPAIIAIIFYACTGKVATPNDGQIDDQYSHIQDSMATKILVRACEAAGGLSKWHTKKNISFSKYYKLLLEDGTIEQEVKQYHTYESQPTSKISINWNDQGNKHSIIYANQEARKMINDSLDTTADNQLLMNSILSSTFVANLPFKIISDEGAKISYAGKDTLEDKKIVECIQVKYYPDQYENHSSEDIWELYFDEKSFYLIAYKVKHDDHISYVKNIKDTIIDGFYFPIDRESYRVTETRELLYLRAVYHYDDYQISF